MKIGVSINSSVQHMRTMLNANFAKSVISRYLTYFDSVFQQHIRLKEQRLSGPLKITLKGTFDDKGFYITGTKDTAQSRILVTTSGSLYVGTWSGNKSQNLSDLAWRNDGLVHTIVIERAQNNYWSFKVDDGENLVSGMLRSGTVQFNSIFAQYGGSTAVPYYSGMPFLMEIEDAGVTYIRYNFDKDMSKTKVVENELAVLGDELLSGTGDGDNWSSRDVTLSNIPDGVLITSTVGSNDRGEFTVSNLTIGDTYLLNVRARRGDQGTAQVIRAATFGNLPNTLIDSAVLRDYEIAFTATAETGLLRIYSSGTSSGAVGDEVIVASASIKQADNYAEAIDVTDSMKFTEVESKTWESEELATLSPVAFDGTEDGYSAKNLGNTPLSAGSTYRISNDVNIISGQLQANLSNWYWNNFGAEHEWVCSHDETPYIQTNTNDKRGVGTVAISIKQILKEAI